MLRQPNRQKKNKLDFRARLARTKEISQYIMFNRTSNESNNAESGVAFLPHDRARTMSCGRLHLDRGRFVSGIHQH